MKTRSVFNRILFTAAIALIIASTILSTACSSGAGVVNGDFSKLGSNKLPTGWTFTSYTNNSINSNAAVVSDPERGNVVRLSNATEDDAHFVQEISVKPNTVYKFSVYAKTENVVGGAGANIGMEDLTYYSTPLTGTVGWTRLELVGKTGASQKTVKVGCRLGNYGATSSGTAYFSDFSAEELKNYSGTAQSIETRKSNSDTNSGETTAVDEKEYKARMRTAAFTIITFILVPLAIGMLVWYEHAAEKRREGEPIRSAAQNAPSFFHVDASLPKKTDTKLHYTKLDWLLVCGLTLVYAVLAVTNLGNMKSPVTGWKAKAGTSATFDFGQTVTISQIWQFGGITGGSGSTGNTRYTLTGTDGTQVEAQQRYGVMFRWNKLDMPGANKSITTDKLTLNVTMGEAWLYELAFIDKDGNKLRATAVDNAYAALVDEPDSIPAYPDYMSGMYFDELYHARTAYEHLNNLKVYEVSHPPLGKLIISLGVAIFGMTPFGWRIMGAIFGILMVPVMYAFGKRMFKRTGLAFLTAALMTFDFMHFAQTRIATIDSYAVFFNLCMTYYMYKFIKMDLGDSFRSTIKPLALSGLFFGIGCSSKWICIYTGAALAVMFFAKMIMQWIKARKINRAELTEEESLEPAAVNAKHFGSRFLKTILVCIPLFIIIPATIYFASYCRYYTAEWKPNAEAAKIARMRASGELDANAEAPENVLTIAEKAKTYVEGVISNQKYMFNYHSGLSTTHAYESRWYEWPLSNRPMWFYAGYNHPDKSLYGTISSFGNPAVWWICFAGTICMLILLLRGRFKFNTELFFILVCMASSMLPWMMISRSVFIYHYFATVPLIIFASVYVLWHYEDRYHYVPKEMGLTLSPAAKFLPKVKYIWVAVTVILFALFYPVISGIPVKRSYVEALQWLPTWTFTGSWPSIWLK
ncbi:MAG: phospholipid carrier-dependent glycosyltransferase [Clostridia bacterium]|nr:phospholipid carrier-dependent glycosyltransferase [Clostridia bacterium]